MWSLQLHERSKTTFWRAPFHRRGRFPALKTSAEAKDHIAGYVFSFQTGHVQIESKDMWETEAQWTVATASVEIWFCSQDPKSGQCLFGLGSNSSTLITRSLLLKLYSSLLPRSNKDALLNVTPGDLCKEQQPFPVTLIPGSASSRGGGRQSVTAKISEAPRSLLFPSGTDHLPPDTPPPIPSPPAHSAVHNPCANSAGTFPAGTGTDG